MIEPWDFSHTWPSFLDQFDINPSQAMVEFGKGFELYFKSYGNSILRSQSRDAQADMLSDLKLHCLVDEFRVLRKYQNVGKPFAYWFTITANNRFRDYLKRPFPALTLDQPKSDNGESKETVEPNQALDEQITWRQILEFTQQCLEKATQKCRRLLLLAAEECTAKEMVELLQWDSYTNVQASNDLRHCRRRLLNCLKDKGIRDDIWAHS